jgi:Flp pilus assembly protein TadB
MVGGGTSVSKARQVARAERERAAAAAAAAARTEQQRVAAERARRARRSLLWRRLRLWQHGSGFRRDRERWGWLGVLVFLGLLVTYLFTRSIGALVGTALIFVIAAPVLVLLFLDRNRR